MIAEHAEPEAVWRAMDEIVRGAEPYQGNQAEAVREAQEILTVESEVLVRCMGPQWIETAKTFIFESAHGTAADVLFLALGDSVRCERTTLNGGDSFFHRAAGACYYSPFPDIRRIARIVLEKAVIDGLAVAEKESAGREIKDLYEKAGKARAKARTRDFIAGALGFFGDRVLSYPAIPWNATPEAIPTLTAVFDFSGDKPCSRQPWEGEYFRDPAPCTAEEILEASEAPRLYAFIDSLFADPDTQKSAIDCLACCISGVPRKTFQVWNNPEGDAGKNTLFDFIRKLIPGRVIMAKNALILYRGDSSERRFGEIQLQGRTGVFFDEVGGTFDIAQIKRYAGLSTIRAEDKGKSAVEFSQTWALVALCNELPRFFPANDGAFLSRVFVLPFSSVFYGDAFDFKRRIAEGISPQRLKPAQDKEALLSGILEERPAIIAELARAWITMRVRGARPLESAECQKAREAYRRANDLAERFFAEYLKRDDYGDVEYSQIKAAWSEFTGEKQPAMRDVVGSLTKRFPFITPTKSHGLHKLRGIISQNGPRSEKTGASGCLIS